MFAYRFTVLVAPFLLGCALAQPGMGKQDDLASPADLAQSDTGGGPVDLREPADDLAGPTLDLPPSPSQPILYPADRTLSPLTPSVVENLRAIAAIGAAKDDVFSKVGDSHTVSTGYLTCLNNTGLDLMTYTDLADGIAHFANGDAGGDDPFDRVSLAAVGGKTASWAITGSPAPIDQELNAVTPRYATVMYGTNEIGSDSPTENQQGVRAAAYGGNMMTLIERIIAAGAIPIISSIPPRTSIASDRMVPLFNAIARAVAQWKQIPFVDVEKELRPLASPKYGLAGDGVHLQTAPSGSCDFSSGGLNYGNNVRNLHTMQMLDRMKSVMFDNDPAPDATAVGVSGTGDRDDPFVIEPSALPFGDSRNTATGGFSEIDTYPGCSATQDESGNEFWYRITLTEPTTLRALVLDRGTVDVDIHFLNATGEASGCLERHDTQVVTNELAAGTYYFVVDTFVKSGVPQAGEYLFVVIKEPL